MNPERPRAWETSDAEYHLYELQIARDPSAPDHLLPPIPEGCEAILDIGCGAGQTLIASRLPPGALACGLDLDRSALALGRSLTAAVHFACARGEALPFRGGSFDFVFSRVALPYMDVPRALAEIGRVLRPGGALWLSLHPPAFAIREMVGAVRARRLRATVYLLYTLLNGLSLHVSNRVHRWPFGSDGFESIQTAGGMRRALARAGFRDIAITRDRFFVAAARKA
jgi:SAM-dependent methyltransferase